MDKNCMTLDLKGYIREMGASVLEFAATSRLLPFAFPCGSIIPGDIVIYVNTNPTGRIELNQYSSVFRLPETDCKNLLYAYASSNNNVQNIVKYNFDFKSNPYILDTVFDGKKIELTADAHGYITKIIADDSRFAEELSPMTEVLLVIGNEGLKMMLHDDHQKIIRAITERSYDAYIQPDYFQKHLVSITDLFDCQIATAMQQILTYKNLEKAIVIEEKRLAIKPLLIDGQKAILKFYGPEAIYQELSQNFNLYKELARCGDVNEEHNVLNTTFSLWGIDEKINTIQFLLQKSCRTDVTIMLTGESGTGKSYLARKIHESSRRSQKKFVPVNCAAIPYNLIESEMFGYEEGAFTGARKGGHEGYFRIADGGTLFLDEITEIPISLQGKLLEAIQNKHFFRVGGTEKVQADIRIIAATNKDLKELVAAKEFREDLYYRLNVFPIEIPPLRQRIDSLEYIIADILPELSYRCNVNPLILGTDALQKLKAYAWPGNIRELSNVLEKAIILSDGKVILEEDIMLPENHCMAEERTLKERKEAFEKALILEALQTCNYERNKTAALLGIGRTSLFEKMRKYDVLTGEETDDNRSY